MDQFNPQSEILPAVLATDLDGTLIPLPGETSNVAALDKIREQHETEGFKIVYATGRHFESVLSAINEFNLPGPDWIVCDVGSSIYHYNPELKTFKLYRPYHDHLAEIAKGHKRDEIESSLASIAGLKLQSKERQQQFKISYECQSDHLDGCLRDITSRLLASGLPYRCIGSIDPFENCGLLDVLPEGVSKAYALIWLSKHADFTADEVVYAGDSGNDRAALVSGFRGILVGNAGQQLAEDIKSELSERGLDERLYIAVGTATSGVLEGCRQFGLIPD